MAFSDCPALKRADLSACTPECGEEPFLQRNTFSGSALESIALPSKMRVMRERALAGCKHLRSVTFGDNPTIEELGPQAFYGCGLESFVAPPSLRKIGGMAFGHCQALKDFKLNEEIEKVDWFCFWNTAITDLAIPPQVKMTPEQLGLDQKTPGVLRFPDGLEAPEPEWLKCGDVEKVIISSSIKVLKNDSFN